MRVLYDYQAFLQRQGGVSRYFVELIDALERIEGYEAVMPPWFSDNDYLESRRTFLTRRHFKGKERIMGALNLLRSRRALRHPFDILHPTYYRPYFLRGLERPFVITVHDMIHEIYHADKIRDDGTSRNKRLLCEKAARIIAVSRSTKDDLCSLLGVPESKVTVVHHATGLRYRGGPRLHGRPYVLYVGARSGYKNFDTFLDAAAVVLRRNDLDLVCAGGGRLTRAEAELVQSRGLSDQVHQVSASSADELASLYHFAALLCYPSLYEGFGFPLLEAFACGCPVAASRTSSIPEVAADAAEYFDPRSADSIAEGMERILHGAGCADGLVAAGTRRLRSFSWEQSARKTYEVYRQAS